MPGQKQSGDIIPRHDRKPLTEPKISGYGKDGIRQAVIETANRVLKSTGKNMFVIVKPSDHAVYADLVNILDEIHIAGAQGYAIENITSPEINLLKQKGLY